MAKRLRSKIALAILALFVAAPAALADVKSGVDSWSRGEYEAAVKQWREPAINGDADAQFNLGQAYKMGRGVKADLNIASDWYRKAATQGHLQAADSYGHLLHYQGKIPESLPYLQTSSDRGDPRAQYLLATELFNGVHIPKDWVRAYAIMTRASSAGMTPASRSLAQMDQYIPLEQRQAAMVLAGELEQRAIRARSAQVASLPVNAAPQPVASKPAIVASTQASPSTKPMPVRPSAVKPAPAKPAPAKIASTNGPWRIQLGAFGKEDNARKLWKSLESRVTELAALPVYLKATGSITRLQAGSFGSKASAEAICGKVKATGQACFAVLR